MNEPHDQVRKLFVTGGSLDVRFIKHIASLTKKEMPKVCFVPTAVGDSLVRINAWYELCEGLTIKPYVLKSFISSYTTKRTFEDILAGMDAIVVGGGNTLNMLAIWRALGIDGALRKAYDAGIIIAGGSAGALCWFESGTTDSRPIDVTKIDGLGWIKGSHSPHYNSEPSRRPLYHNLIMTGELHAGYACDDYSAIYFENEKPVKSFALDEQNKSYYVERIDGKIKETALVVELIA
jgi:peptidase E